MVDLSDHLRTALTDRYRVASSNALRLRTLTAGLTVADLQGSLSWYRDIMGFTVGDLGESGQDAGVEQDVDQIRRRNQDPCGTLASEPKAEPWGARNFALVHTDLMLSQGDWSRINML